METFSTETLSISFDLVGIILLGLFLLQYPLKAFLSGSGSWLINGFEKRSLLNQIVAERY